MDRHTIRKIREVLRLFFDCHLTQRQISASTGVSKGSIADYLSRARKRGLTWQEAETLDDAEVEKHLFQRLGVCEPPRREPIDFGWVHQELRGRGVTLQQLWVEYRESAASRPATGALPYGYSQFCDLYVLGRGVLGKGFDDLLGGPGCTRMLGDIEVDDATAVMDQDEEDEEHAKGCGGDREEIDGRHGADVVVEEGSPGLRGWPARLLGHKPGDAAFADFDAELEQLAVDLRRSPTDVSACTGGS